MIGSKRETEQQIRRNRERLPEAYRRLDADFSALPQLQRDVCMAELGLRSRSAVCLDDNGLMVFPDPAGGVEKDWLKLPGRLWRLYNARVNRETREKEGPAFVQMGQALKEAAEHADSVQACVTALRNARDLIRVSAYSSCRYAELPGERLRKQLEKRLKKLSTYLTEESLMAGLDTPQARMRADLAELIKTCGAAGTVEGEQLTAFLEKYGAWAEDSCYCFDRASWSEAPEKLFDLIRAKLEQSETDGEARQEPFADVLARLEKELKPAAFRRLNARIGELRSQRAFTEQVAWLRGEAFLQCRRLADRLEDLLGVEAPGDLRYLSFAELEKLNEPEDLDGALRETIRKRKDAYPYAAMDWELRQDACFGRLHPAEDEKPPESGESKAAPEEPGEAGASAESEQPAGSAEA